ncbi:hypothetical protein V1511DRAFT_493271 [Dipodascopsis uninucleata]
MSGLRYPHLISRWGDIFFGVFIGTASFAMHERRHNVEEGQRLIDLVQRRWDKFMSNEKSE